MNNRANQQEMVILIEMYKTLPIPILWTFKTQHSKCEVSNKVQWQAVSQASKFRL